MVCAVRCLLDELSWEGNAWKYREGGLGLENVLTAEVFQALDFLPREAFLGAHQMTRWRWAIPAAP